VPRPSASGSGRWAGWHADEFRDGPGIKPRFESQPLRTVCRTLIGGLICGLSRFLFCDHKGPEALPSCGLAQGHPATRRLSSSNAPCWVRSSSRTCSGVVITGRRSASFMTRAPGTTTCAYPLPAPPPAAPPRSAIELVGPAQRRTSPLQPDVVGPLIRAAERNVERFPAPSSLSPAVLPFKAQCLRRVPTVAWRAFAQEIR